MNISESENFPRGGKRIVNTNVQNKRKHEDNLFDIGISQKKKKTQKEKDVKNVANKDEMWQLSLKLEGTLTYNKMQEGMLILSCVRQVSNMTIQIEFPGITFGVVTITQISDVFNKKLSKELQSQNENSYSTALKDIVKVGQFMPAKILLIIKTEKGYEIEATVNPKNINSDKQHKSFKKGETVWANVVSELDHGYELTVGVHNCRVFLPFKNVDDSKKYDIGEPLFCIVNKVESSDSATTLTVSAKSQQIDNFKGKDLTLNDVIPGTQVDMVIEEISLHGIKGQFYDSCFGYIDESQLILKKAKLKEGSIVKAYVLYVEPVTKVTYLTLNGIENVLTRQYELGKIMTAKVLSTVSKGLYLELGKNNVGFVTNKRLLNTLPKDSESEIINAVRKKYPVDSHHECRILDYNYMEALYICTFEKKIIKEKIFSIKDLTIGQMVKVTVEKVIPKGLFVKCGYVQGFVPNTHLSNVKYSENLKSKFAVGLTFDARVLNVTSEEHVIFTLKQSLLDSEKCLSEIEDIVPKSQYVGFVLQTKISGALVAFYGDVKGWISNKTLNSGNSGKYLDPRDFFFIGQVVTVWVLGFNNDKLQLSLNEPKRRKQVNIAIGEKLNGVITTVGVDHVKAEVGPHKIGAVIPTAHLTNDLQLCNVMQKMYKPKQVIKDLMCINNTGLLPIMSRRENIAFTKNELKICKLRDLKDNMVLRCSFEENTDTGIYVSSPIKDHCKNIFIPKANIHPGSTFTKQGSILTKIANVNWNTSEIQLKTISEDSLNKDLNNMLNSFIQNIEDLEYIIHLSNKRNTKLTGYKIGDRVKCTIQKVDANGDCFVKLENNAEGIMRTHLKPGKCTVGLVIEGVVLDYNFEENLVEISGKASVNQKINKAQVGFLSKTFHSSCVGKVVLITKFYAIGILNDKQCNRQLVYIPLSTIDNSDHLYEDKLKIVVCRRVGNRIIALPKKFSQSLEKQFRKHENFNMIKENLKREIEEVHEDVTNKSKKTKLNELTEDEIMDSGTKKQNLKKADKEPKDMKNKRKKEKVKPKLDKKSTDDEDDQRDSFAIINTEKEENNDEDNIIEESSEVDKPKSDVRYFSNGLENRISYKSESILSGTQSFYLTDNMNKDFSDSSSDDEEEEQTQIRKKKKLTPAERAEAAKKEEERISQIEKQLADTTTAPQSAQQFDRVLLANPNSSELWLQYIAMHVAATELDKARAVGRKAIETISMTCVKEKFNIWIALLNLENMYGTKESLEKLFEEAVKYNDSLDIYLNVIRMLAESGKLIEMEEKIKKIRTKEKQNSKMWLDIGRVYYTLKMFREARNIKESALKSILDKKRQFDIIMRFGIMEFQLGEPEQAIANFETILETYPSKVTIWTIYVDQLVKLGNIELARKVLERAICQKLGMRTMKVFYQKFILFEEQHGNAETVEKVKGLAKEYVANIK